MGAPFQQELIGRAGYGLLFEVIVLGQSWSEFVGRLASVFGEGCLEVVRLRMHRPGCPTLGGASSIAER